MTGLIRLGGLDENIPQDQIDEYDRALGAAGVEHELVSYPGAPHSFFDRSFEEHAEACEDAWRRDPNPLFLAVFRALAPTERPPRGRR